MAPASATGDQMLAPDSGCTLERITSCKEVSLVCLYNSMSSLNPNRNAAKPVGGRATNNVGEIQAAIYAIRTALALGINKLCISTDSQFLINSITQWVPGWKRRNWMLRNNQPVKNVVDFKELDELLQSKDLTVKWVRILIEYLQKQILIKYLTLELRGGPQGHKGQRNGRSVGTPGIRFVQETEFLITGIFKFTA